MPSGARSWSATIVDALRASRNNRVRFDIRGSFAGGAVVPGIIVTRAIRGDQGGGCPSITASSPAYLGDAASRPPPSGNGVVDFAQHAHHHLMQLGIIRILAELVYLLPDQVSERLKHRVALR
jgi:hypothetical protein